MLGSWLTQMVIKRYLKKKREISGIVGKNYSEWFKAIMVANKRMKANVHYTFF